MFNHTKAMYGAGSQNWDIKYDEDHVYFANNGGILCYNGISWHTVSTTNNTIVRSLVLDREKRIFAGAQNEIGYAQPDAAGRLEFTDLISQIKPELKNLSEIWDIEIIDDRLYFSSDFHINVLNEGSVQRFGHDSHITNMSRIDRTIWYHTESAGTFIIENHVERRIDDNGMLKGKNVRQCLESAEGFIYIITEKNGIYIWRHSQLSKWETNADDYLVQKRISSAIYHPDHGLFIGTYLGGFININEAGLTTLVMTKKNGLQNNTVNSMAITPNGILWLATNNGIDEIEITSSYRRFYPDGELEGAVYDFEEWKNKYYFSTSNGLYYIDKKDYYNPLSAYTFKIVQGTEGQAWATYIIDNQLYCAHHEGPMIITDNQDAKRISEERGCWNFVKLSEDITAVGGYYGVSLYKKDSAGKLRFLRKLEGLEESSRIMVYDNHGYLWVSHPYKNIYRIQFSADFASESIRIYSARDGFKKEDRNYVFNINGHCYLTNETGIYRYDAHADVFEINHTLNRYFEEGNHVRRLINHDQYIWAISDQATTRFTVTDTGLDVKITRMDLENFPTVGNYIGGFEELFILDDETLIISSEEGAIEFIMGERKSYDFAASIKSISLPLHRDSIIYGGIGSLPDIKLESNQNAIRIELNSTYPNASRTKNYSIKHTSGDNIWSEWNLNPVKEYTNLEYGEHVFDVRASTQHGLISDPVEIRLFVKSPWYLGWPAFTVYALLIIAVLGLMIIIPRKKYIETTSILEQENQKNQEEIESIKQEKLLDEIKFKNQELASNTLHLLQKNQTLITLRTKFDELKKLTENQKVKKELNNILSIFRNDLRLDDDWQRFSMHFDEVHHDFIKKLKSKHPELSTNDHKLCAYLKMNLSTKEIAPLLNISVRGVEISRYRLRKKLKLDRSVNLNEYFNNEMINSR